MGRSVAILLEQRVRFQVGHPGYIQDPDIRLCNELHARLAGLITEGGAQNVVTQRQATDCLNGLVGINAF